MNPGAFYLEFKKRFENGEMTNMSELEKALWVSLQHYVSWSLKKEKQIDGIKNLVLALCSDLDIDVEGDDEY